ncbi:MAG: DUF4281 domain-containing protein [Burkholderiales bacterium]|nr:MAG: DUF4281 domain-containing protein [Burkholderiales bacterium]
MTPSPELVFQVGNTLAACGWLALVLSPAKAAWTPRVWRVTGWYLPLLLSAAYLVMLVTHWRGQGGFSSLADVQDLFRQPGVLTAGWLHYLAFDLFVGAWIAHRCARLGVAHGWVVVLMLLTFMLGPVGLLGYLLAYVLKGDQAKSFQPGAHS